MDFTFHIACPEDIPVIQRLSRRIWRAHYPGIISPEQIEYMLAKMYAVEVLKDEMERQGYRYVLAVQDNEPIGYLAFRMDRGTASMLLSKIYLDPAHHAKGIGRRMLDHAAHEARQEGCATITLFVNKKNEKAIRAYERFGFTIAESIVTDIGNGFVMDDYRMVYTILPDS